MSEPPSKLEHTEGYGHVRPSGSGSARFQPSDRTPRRLGRFEIEAELARGGMGAVYRAFDPGMERTVAIKTILSAWRV